MNNYVEKAVEHFGGNQAAMARAIGVSQPMVHRMVKTGHVSPRLCRVIERETGGAVTAEELRPDIFAPVQQAS